MSRRPRPPRRPHEVGDGGVRDVAIGFACLGRGLVHVARRPKLFWLGALPPLVAALVLFGLVGLLVWGSGPLATWLTPWAADWHPTVLDVTRGLLSAMIVLGGVLLSVLAFAGLTMAVGAPFYDRISATVDKECGDLAAAPDVPPLELLRRGAADAAATVGFSALVALVVFLVSLVPAVGQVAAPVLGAVAGGWLLVLELVQPSFERRGLTRLKDRRAWVRRFREVALGFGVPVYLALLVPLLGIVVFPGAVAGATLLTRSIRREPCVPRDQA